VLRRIANLQHAALLHRLGRRRNIRI
jgi:hypothetical protein